MNTGTCVQAVAGRSDARASCRSYSIRAVTAKVLIQSIAALMSMLDRYIALHSNIPRAEQPV